MNSSGRVPTGTLTGTALLLALGVVLLLLGIAVINKILKVDI